MFDEHTATGIIMDALTELDDAGKVHALAYSLMQVGGPEHGERLRRELAVKATEFADMVAEHKPRRRGT